MFSPGDHGPAVLPRLTIWLGQVSPDGETQYIPAPAVSSITKSGEDWKEGVLEPSEFYVGHGEPTLPRAAGSVTLGGSQSEPSGRASPATQWTKGGRAPKVNGV